MPEPQQQARTKFVIPKINTRGIITEVQIEQEPFHCTLKITPKDPTVISIEGRYSSNELSLGKLRRNLVHLKFKIESLEDILAALESLEGRECDFRIDKSGWLEWISHLYPKQIPMSILPETRPPEETEIFFTRLPGRRCIYRMDNQDGGIVGYAAGPTGSNSAKPHGWVLYLETIEQAQEVLIKRKQNERK
jgi:hypothetical protein